MATIQLQIFENKLFKEKLEQLVKSLMKQIISQDSLTEVDGKWFSTIIKKKMSDVESVTSDSSYFFDEIVSDVSYNALRDDPVTSIITEQQEDTYTITEVEMSATTLSRDSGSFTDDPKTSVSTEEGAQEPGIIKETDPFIMRTLRGIKKVAPNLRYKPKNLRRKKFKVIPYEFASVWKNVSSIFSEDEGSNHSKETILPKVAWEKVNVGGLKKLPSPKKFPILSASLDPTFYLKDCSCQKTKEGILCACTVCDARQAKYLRVYPHGFVYGFPTNLGVIPVPDTPMFGHVWDDSSSSWMLHAEISPDDTPPSYPSEKRGRTPPRRRSRGSPRRTWRRRVGG